MRVSLGRAGSAFRNLPLVWKLVLPLSALLVLVAVLGMFVVVRSLSLSAEESFRQDLSRRALNAQAAMIDAELSLLDAARFTANQQGMPAAVAAGDAAQADVGVRSALALDESLQFVAVVRGDGAALIQVERSSPESVAVSAGDNLGDDEVVRRALGDPSASKHSGFLGSYFVVTAPVRSAEGAVVGAAVAGVSAQRVARTAADRSEAGVTIYDESGRRVASAGEDAFGNARPPDGPGRVTASGTEVDVLPVDVRLDGDSAGTIVVAVPRGPVLAPVRSTGYRLAAIMALAIAAVVGLAVAVTRSVLAQVRHLVEANRTFGAGELSARTPVLGRDELGELAEGFNQMASALSETYEQLEQRVADRTAELAEAHKRLEETHRAQSDFFSRMSHELRSPLFVITGNAELLESADGLPGIKRRRGELAAAIRDAGGQVGALIDELLEFKRLEAGRMPVNTKAVDVRVPVQSVVKALKPLADLAGTSLVVDLPDDLPFVSADASHVEKILRNLVGNAIKYTPDGGTVTVYGAHKTDEVEISVADTGVGIPPEAGDRIFEAFYRVEGVQARAGQSSSGLGLALTKELVEVQGGRIWHESEPGAGTTFTFTLPAAAAKRSRARATRSSG